MTGQPPPEGWYDDPDDPTQHRWWDGQVWTGARRPKPPAPTPPPAAPASTSRKRMGPATKTVIVAFAGFFALVLLGSVLSGDGTPADRPPSSGDDFGAYLACEEFVENQLRAPATAEFIPERDADITSSGSEWTVRGWVDAENGFGANVRSDFTCTARYDDGTWRGRAEVDTR